MDRHLDEFMESHISHDYGSILDQLNSEDRDREEHPDLDYDEPWDSTLEQQELEDFEQADEYFGFYGDGDEW